MSDPNPYQRMPHGDSLGGTPARAVAEVGTPAEPSADRGLEGAGIDADAD